MYEKKKSKILRLPQTFSRWKCENVCVSKVFSFFFFFLLFFFFYFFFKLFFQDLGESINVYVFPRKVLALIWRYQRFLVLLQFFRFSNSDISTFFSTKSLRKFLEKDLILISKFVELFGRNVLLLFFFFFLIHHRQLCYFNAKPVYLLFFQIPISICSIHYSS